MRKTITLLTLLLAAATTQAQTDWKSENPWPNMECTVTGVRGSNVFASMKCTGGRFSKRCFAAVTGWTAATDPNAPLLYSAIAGNYQKGFQQILTGGDDVSISVTGGLSSYDSNKTYLIGIYALHTDDLYWPVGTPSFYTVNGGLVSAISEAKADADGSRWIESASAVGLDGVPAAYTLYDANGRTLRTTEAAAISVDGLPHGTYVVAAKTAAGTVTRKITR